MAPITIVFGILLIGLGAGGFLAAGVDVKNITAMIPAFVGLPLLLLGLVALNEKVRMHAMHGAVLVGLLGFLGGVANIVRVLMKPDGSLTTLAGLCTLGMTLLCAAFVGLCVNSFIQARRARRAREQAQS